ARGVPPVVQSGRGGVVSWWRIEVACGARPKCESGTARRCCDVFTAVDDVSRRAVAAWESAPQMLPVLPVARDGGTVEGWRRANSDGGALRRQRLESARRRRRR